MVGFNTEQGGLTQKQYVAAGAMSGMITRFLCMPLEVLKVRFQVKEESVNIYLMHATKIP